MLLSDTQFLNRYFKLFKIVLISLILIRERVRNKENTGVKLFHRLKQ